MKSSGGGLRGLGFSVDGVRVHPGEKLLLTLLRPVMGQFAHPHGPLGWLAALVIPMGHRQYYPKAAAALQLRPDDVLLDVACGSGEFLDERAAHVAAVTGVDLSDIEVRLARRKLRDRIAAGTAEIVQGDASALPLPDKTYTAVNCVGAFLALEDPARALAEMYRVLRPGGRAVVCLEMHADDGKDHTNDQEYLGIPLYTEKQIHDLFTQAGFNQVSITPDNEVMVARGVRGQP